MASSPTDVDTKLQEPGSERAKASKIPRRPGLLDSAGNSGGLSVSETGSPQLRATPECSQNTMSPAVTSRILRMSNTTPVSYSEKTSKPRNSASSHRSSISRASQAQELPPIQHETLGSRHKPLPSPPVVQVIDPNSRVEAPRTLIDAEAGSPTDEQWPILYPENVSPPKRTRDSYGLPQQYRSFSEGPTAHRRANLPLGSHNFSMVTNTHDDNFIPMIGLPHLSSNNPYAANSFHAISTATDVAAESPLAYKNPEAFAVPVSPLMSSKRSSLLLLGEDDEPACSLSTDLENSERPAIKEPGGVRQKITRESHHFEPRTATVAGVDGVLGNQSSPIDRASSRNIYSGSPPSRHAGVRITPIRSMRPPRSPSRRTSLPVHRATSFCKEEDKASLDASPAFPGKAGRLLGLGEDDVPNRTSSTHSSPTRTIVHRGSMGGPSSGPDSAVLTSPVSTVLAGENQDTHLVNKKIRFKRSFRAMFSRFNTRRTEKSPTNVESKRTSIAATGSLLAKQLQDSISFKKVRTPKTESPSQEDQHSLERKDKVGATPSPISVTKDDISLLESPLLSSIKEDQIHVASEDGESTPAKIDKGKAPLVLYDGTSSHQEQQHFLDPEEETPKMPIKIDKGKGRLILDDDTTPTQEYNKLLDDEDTASMITIKAYNRHPIVSGEDPSSSSAQEGPEDIERRAGLAVQDYMSRVAALDYSSEQRTHSVALAEAIFAALDCYKVASQSAEQAQMHTRIAGDHLVSLLDLHESKFESSQ